MLLLRAHKRLELASRQSRPPSWARASFDFETLTGSSGSSRRRVRANTGLTNVANNEHFLAVTAKPEAKHGLTEAKDSPFPCSRGLGFSSFPSA